MTRSRSEESMIELRHCMVCHFVKESSDFYPRQRRECKECTKKRMKNTRDANIEYYRLYDKARANLPHRLELSKRVSQQWKAKHPNRRAAQTALGNAVRDGRVIPWPVCAVPECNGKPEAHHPDYSRPLDVVWLCSAHHKQTHAMAKKLMMEAA